MKIVIGSDHAAFDAKTKLITFLENRKISIVDVGTSSEQRCDYPIFAAAVCQKVLEEKILGIVLCGSGIGVSMVANRFSGIRAALCRSVEDARLSRQHNNANVLCMGGRSSSQEDINSMAMEWLASFFEGGRHSGRLALFDSLGVSPEDLKS